MNNSNLSIDTELLINYAYGLLAPDLASRVKQALEKDETLREEYEGIVYLIQTYPGEDPADVMEKMLAEIDHKLDTAVPDKKKISPPVRRRWIIPVSVAASVILIFNVGIFMWKSHQRNPVLIAHERVREKYHDPVDAIEGTERGEADTSWRADFDEENYPAVIRKLSSLPAGSLGSREEFYYGLSYLKAQQQQIDQAEQHLQRSTRSQSLYQNDAWYYLGIIQLLRRDVKGAKKYLLRAKNPPASELLEQQPE